MSVFFRAKYTSLLWLFSAMVIAPAAIAGDSEELTAKLHEFLAGCGVAGDEDSRVLI